MKEILLTKKEMVFPVLLYFHGQTHSNNLPTNCLSVFDHFVGLTLKVLTNQFNQFQASVAFLSRL